MKNMIICCDGTVFFSVVICIILKRFLCDIFLKKYFIQVLFMNITETSCIYSSKLKINHGNT